MLSLAAHLQFGAVVIHAYSSFLTTEWLWAVRTNKDDTDVPLCSHAGILPLAGAYGEGNCGLVPGDGDGSILPVFVGVGGAVIIIKGETAISAGIDVKRQWSVWLFGSV